MDAIVQWEREIGLDAGNLLCVAFGGHPMAPETQEVIRTVRDHLTGVLERIAAAQAQKAAQESSATAVPAKKGKRK